MRKLVAGIAVAGLIFVNIACTSSTDAEECTIEGTYTATGVQESGNCDFGKDSPPVTDTITKLPNGRYRLEIQSLAGACDLDQVAACKLQGKCAIGITDAIEPGADGTVQYSWTFTRDGFNGFSAISVPPAKSLPDGCSATAIITGKRR